MFDATEGDTYPPLEFSVSVTTEGASYVVRVTGELDLGTVPELALKTRKLVAEGQTVRYELGGLTFIDSTGLRYFLDVYEAAQRDGFAFSITRPRGDVLRAFKVTALDDVMPWADER